MPQLSMSLWLGLVQLALVPVTETVISQTSVVEGPQTNNILSVGQHHFEQHHVGRAQWTENSTTV
ncbi:MAG: hypothetical protein AAFV46_13445 [Cyanobacteria bacterium J06635_11]